MILWDARVPRERGEKDDVELGKALVEIMLPGNHESRRGQIHLVQHQHQGQPELSSHILVQRWREVHNLGQGWQRMSNARSTRSSLL